MTKLKHERNYSLEMGESLARILKIIHEAIEHLTTDAEIAQCLMNELIEILAKEECKRHYDMPAWGKLNSKQRQRLLKGGEKTLMTINEFWNGKVEQSKK